jgi:hypothetical protein
MQLFSRSVMFNGPFGDVMAYATDMRQFVSDKTAREVGLWSVMFGAPLGAMVYAARVDGLADLQSIGATLVGDADYHAKLAKGRDFVAGPAEDNLATPIHGELGDPPPVGSVAVVTTAAIANGAYAEAIAWGVDIAQHVERVAGVPTLFLANDFGAFGQVTWIGVSPDAAAADAAGQKINADPDYLGKLASAGTLFAQGTGHRTLLSRVA